MDPHGKSTASKLKFVFQYIIFPTWIFSLEEFWSLKPYKGIPTHHIAWLQELELFFTYRCTLGCLTEWLTDWLTATFVF